MSSLPVPETHQPKWFNSPMTYHAGPIAELRQKLPTFERRGFGLAMTDPQFARLNQRLDTVVRLPSRGDAYRVPVGVVSKSYQLLQHTEVLDFACAVLGKANLPLDEVQAELGLTEYGERMELSLRLPEKYAFDPGDGHPMALRLECWNSVDGSTRFRALMGWFRLVCSNGLIIGVTHSDYRRRHVGDLQLKDIGRVFTSGLQAAETDKARFTAWRASGVKSEQIKPWVERDVYNAWGFKAAARAYHIANTGHDVTIAGTYAKQTPSTIDVSPAGAVPGTPSQSRNLYDLSQVLAWLAKERRDVQEQLEWRGQIAGLMAALQANT
jgi:hypothetical protein